MYSLGVGQQTLTEPLRCSSGPLNNERCNGAICALPEHDGVPADRMPAMLCQPKNLRPLKSVHVSMQ